MIADELYRLLQLKAKEPAYKIIYNKITMMDPEELKRRAPLLRYLASFSQLEMSGEKPPKEDLLLEVLQVIDDDAELAVIVQYLPRIDDEEDIGGASPSSPTASPLPQGSHSAKQQGYHTRNNTSSNLSVPTSHQVRGVRLCGIT